MLRGARNQVSTHLWNDPVSHRSPRVHVEYARPCSESRPPPEPRARRNDGTRVPETHPTRPSTRTSPVDLMEYQAKELFAKHGVTTTLGTVVTTPEEARAAAEEYGFCVVKAQVKAGGRGKAGGVKLAKTPDEAFEHAGNILGMEIKGLRVNRVLVTPATPPV